MRILATDLDRTLLPNGSWPPDPGAIDLFNELTQKHDVLVVYVTGRNLNLTENAIREFGIRYPDVLIGDVGTSIRKYELNDWKLHGSWNTHVKRASPKWDADPELRLYFAKGGFKGLNGFYTSGVIEGAYHYGIFYDAD